MRPGTSLLSVHRRESLQLTGVLPIPAAAVALPDPCRTMQPSRAVGNGSDSDLAHVNLDQNQFGRSTLHRLAGVDLRNHIPSRNSRLTGCIAVEWRIKTPVLQHRDRGFEQ